MSRKTLIIAGVAFLLLVMGTGAVFYVLYGKIRKVGGDKPPVVETAQKEGLSNGMKKTFPLKTFVVNLADPGGKRYLRVSMVLELDSDTPEMTSELKKKLPQINDRILMILPSKTFEEIRTLRGKLDLKEEIVQGLNSFLESGKISGVYFEEFVVQ